MKKNLEIAYILAYILFSKHNAQIVDIVERDDYFFVDFLSGKKISKLDFIVIEKEISSFCNEKNKWQIEKMEQKHFETNNFVKDELAKRPCDLMLQYDNFFFPFFQQNNKKLDFSSSFFFTLDNVSGVYWKGDAKNIQLQEITGFAFSTQQELIKFTTELHEKKETDHRKIGQELELFTFNDLVGKGLPIWLPNGTIIKTQIENRVHEILEKNDYQFVQTPVLGSDNLYKTSGHWQHYRENMFPPISIDDEKFVLRPMTCPHHMVIYLSKNHSYRDLPFRIAEHAILHRYEPTGSLIGLERVRSMQLVDTHVIISLEQITSEIKHCYKTIKECLDCFHIDFYSIDLSLHDPRNKQKFFDNEEMWNIAETTLEKCCQQLEFNFVKKIGEAAFYGPKIDFQIKTVLGHIVTISTIQLDFLLPKKFNLLYKDKSGNFSCPILIHGGIIGTFERFLSILLEQTKGVLPLWLVPQQVVIIPINDVHLEYCKKIFNILKEQKIRAFVDCSNERIAKKIRNANIKKIPYQIVIGDQEIKNGLISYRCYAKNTVNQCKISNLMELIENSCK